MNGDLSLSQSLGGLRIANPDKDESLSSVPSSSTPVPPFQIAAQPPAPGSHIPPVASNTRNASNPELLPTESHLPAPSKGVDIGSLGFDPASYDTESQSLYHSDQHASPLSNPLIQRSNQPQPLHDVQNSPYPRHYNPSSIRPSSGIYHLQNMPAGPASVPESSYQRVRAESAQSSASAGSEIRRNELRPAPIDVPSARISSNRSNRQHASSNASSSNAFHPLRSSKPAANAADAAAPHSTEESKDRAGVVGARKAVEPDAKPPSKSAKKGVKDFNFGRTLGEGSYSTVLAATDRATLKEYAIKVLDKKHIIKEKKVKYVNIEKDTLNRLTDHPGVVRLYYTFQDERSLYFVLDLATGGELLGVLKKMVTFDEECSRFYSAQILDAIEYMHLRGIIHRDLKPENVLLDDQMHVKITDFGTAKILDLTGTAQFGKVSVSNDPLDGADTDRAVSFVGTAEYVSPELLTDKNACKASDLWAFGCIVYQLLAGRPPFKAVNEYQTFQKIVHLDYSFPDGFPSVARDLITRLLVLNPADRPHVEEIKSHPFFNGVTWGKGLWKQKPPKLRSYNAQTSQDAKLKGQPAEPPFKHIPAPQQPKQAKPTQNSTTPPRPQPKIIAELAPPSQLDIDWSPVLTKANERIVKLGQLVVYSTPAPHSPTSRNGSNGESQAPAEAPSKFSRLFGGGVTKKRQRLVMVTSGARLVLAPSGGDKKEAKQIVNLSDPDVTWKSQQDAKGYTVWCVLTRERHLTFEDPKANTGDAGSSMRSTQEWLDIIQEVKDYGFSRRTTDPFPEDSMSGLGPSISNPTPSTETEDPIRADSVPAPSHHRKMLRRDQDTEDESSRGFRRFSKRHSKNGLAAVF